MKAVLLAGGKGRRLQPFTTTIPKPLFPIGEKPIMQIIIEQLKTFGVSEFIISLGYLGGLIEAYFGDGSKFGTKITYIHENEPLGTAGAISLLPELDESYIFMNGDILSTVDFNAAYKQHLSNGSLMTICTFEKKVQSSLGVLQLDGEQNVTAYIEKPITSHIVSSGIYIMSPEINSFIPKQVKLDIPELVQKLIAGKYPISTFAIEGKWFDIGTPEDLELAEEFLINNQKLC
jgi:mannose-1-phosphate guanylyltransferase